MNVMLVFEIASRWITLLKPLILRERSESGAIKNTHPRFYALCNYSLSIPRPSVTTRVLLLYSIPWAASFFIGSFAGSVCLPASVELCPDLILRQFGKSANQDGHRQVAHYYCMASGVPMRAVS